ncbi:transcriptional regulator GcvA [Paralimibaculum aggregatum]|uniref:Transcriptional regulator GcvA n=1 Tax=Paralimibaculum aggregatum TaxID=3036245 RepID=A0ABQ6LBQ0_9RHOB|nr:LysR substrate-binding domain-containing protein [Limibaculum sp. NKW23]GMG80837.1 transcriptional regulator GcvA [Limibaculum sp. NKW23]
MHKLPPLNALRVFEAVSRHGGVRAAAGELCVTPPAVSHQIANLEDWLGAALFVRRGRSLVLTETGQDYLKEIRPSLEAIGRATTVASQRKARETLTLAAPPTLTAKWLMPRLGGFMAAHPTYDLRLIDRMTFDPEEPGIDLAIEYRYEPDPDLVSLQILPDEVVALSTAAYAEANGLRSPADLRGLTLIETERRLTSWKTILADYPWAAQQRFLYVSYSLHAFEAAAQGLGVAIGNRANVAELIAEGRLRVPFAFDEATVPPMPRYYLSTVPHKARLERVRAFRDWMQDHLAGADQG